MMLFLFLELLNQDSFNFYNNMATEPSQHPVYRGLLLPGKLNNACSLSLLYKYANEVLNYNIGTVPSPTQPI